MFNSKSKVEAMKSHIELRERFFEVKYNLVQRAYAMFRMTFHSEALILSANDGLVDLLASHGNFKTFKDEVEGR